MPVPSQDQIMGQLRVAIPALGTLISAFGVSSTSVDHYASIALTMVGPISYVAVAIWSLIANSRSSIMASAAKPVSAGIAAPKIVLPPEEALLADKLPSNVSAPPVVKK